MRDVFEYIFQLRYVKEEKLIVSFRDFIMILIFYFHNKFTRVMNFKEFYYLLMDISITTTKPVREILKNTEL